ncbi:MAG TPA: glycosyltransferase family 39 protein [Blastocatellia bacterium]|nr:glycosyltransferase family 39 protein [Blastocatellia bacterium]
MQAPALESGSDQPPLSRDLSGRATAIRVFLALLFISFLLRIPYIGHLFQDDGLWFTAAEEILRGRMLYSEIYFDKPPAIALLYAALFKLFGAHILTIRLFTVFHSVAVSAVVYLFGSRLYDRRTGLLAAVFFAVFSTTYTTGHVQGLNTDFLMTLPYTAAAYLFARSASEYQRRKHISLALIGGALAGVAFQINPKGSFDLLFFALLLIFALLAPRSTLRRSDALFSSLAAAAGFAAGAAPFWLYIALNGAWPAYKSFVWDWGARYAGYHSASEVVLTALRQTISYLSLNNTLLFALAFVVWRVFKNKRRARIEPAPEAGFEADSRSSADMTILLWLAVSYAAMAVGGRFFGHYFFQIIPSLCLIGARGLTGIFETAGALGRGGKARLLRGGVLAIIVLGFIFTLVRFHGRTLVVAFDQARGSKSEMTAGWFHERLKREERMVAAVVRKWPGGADAAEQAPLEAFRLDGPRGRVPEGPQDYLFVWGYRPEIYYWSGLLPASRYLSTQPLTGVAADVHYFGGQHGFLLGEDETAPARAELVRELSETRPEYVIDELGFFNNDLSILSYPELAEFMKDYRRIGVTGRFFVYHRRDMSKKRRKAN